MLSYLGRDLGSGAASPFASRTWPSSAHTRWCMCSHQSRTPANVHGEINPVRLMDSTRFSTRFNNSNAWEYYSHMIFPQYISDIYSHNHSLRLEMARRVNGHTGLRGTVWQVKSHTQRSSSVSSSHDPPYRRQRSCSQVSDPEPEPPEPQSVGTHTNTLFNFMDPLLI